MPSRWPSWVGAIRWNQPPGRSSQPMAGPTRAAISSTVTAASCRMENVNTTRSTVSRCSRVLSSVRLLIAQHYLGIGQFGRVLEGALEGVRQLRTNHLAEPQQTGSEAGGREDLVVTLLDEVRRMESHLFEDPVVLST